MGASSLPRRPLIAAAVGLVGAHCLWFRDHVVDDAFITMRYARHLVEGSGAVFNTGERVEGYTNFLWMGILAAAHALGLSQPLVAVELGAACVLAVVLFVMVVEWPGLDRETGVVAGLLLACCGPFVFWGTSGLETGLFTALVLVSIWLFLRGRSQPSHGRLDWILSLTVALATLTRPEGVLLWLLLLVARMIDRGGRPRSSDLGLCLPYLLIIGTHLCWRWTYYGQLLPNSYHAKVGHQIDEIVMGLRYLGEWLVAYWVLLPLALGARRRAAAGTTVLLACTVVLFTAAIVWVGGDNFPMLRFFAPMMPLLCLLAAAGVLRLPSRRLRALSLVGVCALLAVPSCCGRQFGRATHDTLDVQAWSELGRWLDDHLTEGQSVALNPVGAVGYFCHHRIVDMLGINDAAIARSEPRPGPPGHRRADAAHVLGLQPTIVLIGVNHPLPPEASSPSFTPVYESDRELLALDAFHELYEPAILATEHHRFSAMVRLATPTRGMGAR